MFNSVRGVSNMTVHKTLARARNICLSFTIFLLMMIVVRGPPATVEEELMLAARLSGPLSYDDPDLLHVVTHFFLHPPSTLPYHLVRDQQYSAEKVTYSSYENEFAFTFYKNVMNDLFEGAPPGFFVEAGALDGEFLSNTLSLETNSGWTGLLVETDGDMFNQLLRKRRQSWACHTCLATQAHPHLAILVKYLHNSHFNTFTSHSARARGSLMSVAGGANFDMSEQSHRAYESVQCLPLATLLLAMNITHVDMVSLDVEGAEEDILRHFPWDRITVDVWLVEHQIHTPSDSIYSAQVSFSGSSPDAPRRLEATNNHKFSTASSKQEKVDGEFVSMFIIHGYELYKVKTDPIPDYVFIRKDSKVDKRLKARGLSSKIADIGSHSL
ncbi:uncharacterized protein [Cherax quadricarinatus]|uniref:uncharacterized protein n=1 Tax=Cherax quadricarinatus TaxID=27406 RepID=UPI002379513F|nr:uncharacterized protein LOC128689656 [Cherax quadricarinatus]